ncbi:MAG: MBL fold metallo-hydrolase [Acidobacteria bacterium]|nr:MAG: MBL fold metallo-hydrolase [Acidobacteriota bacterium]
MTDRLVPIEGNGQRLDGGSMFGNAPRAVWEKWLPPDDLGRVRLATRALLLRGSDRLILFEAGIGLCFEPKLRARYGVTPDDRHVLLESLAREGLSDRDIDVVVLSHLHFDHAGGILAEWREGEPPRLLFPNARFLVSRAQFERARHPHLRDRASYLPEIPDLLEASGRLELVDGERSDATGPSVRFHYSEGHTPGMLLSEIETPEGPVLFVADLAPGRPWVHLPITMGYDRWPERLIDEKRELFSSLLPRGGRLFFTHDPDTPFARLERDERGRFTANPC